MPEVAALEVRLHGQPIGSIARIAGDRSIFAFEESYVQDQDRPTLSLGFKDSYGNLMTKPRAFQTKLHPFFSNLLPEGHLRDYLAARAGVKPVREFQLLHELGADLPGAISIAPLDGVVEEDPLSGNEVRIADAKSGPLRFSLAGVQLKFSAIKNRGRGGGLTVPASGAGGEWIIKLPSAIYEAVPENEFSMMSIARQIGIDVPEIGIVPLDEIEGLPSDLGRLRGNAFVIRRFDRNENGPVHMEDFAQVFGVYPDDKYEKASYRSIATVLGMETDEASISQFIRRLVFSALIGNADMHLKNWTLIYPDRRRPILSPAYDLLSTIPYIPDENAAMKYARTKRMDEFSYDELSYLAAKARLSTAPILSEARETVEAFMAVWSAEKSHLPLAAGVTEALDAHLEKLPICSS